MFEDARQLADGSDLHADICIVGAGAAGLTLATEFVGAHFSVLLVESGSLAYESRTQALYSGINAGLLYEPLDLCRVRTFGGSTDPRGWGGWCKPLADIDFERREWVPLSGWPITKRHLAPYYRRAFRTLSLRPDTEALAENDARGQVLPVPGLHCRNEPCPLSPAPHLGEVNQAFLRTARNVRVLLNANVTEIVTDRYGKRAIGVKIATLEKKLSPRWPRTLSWPRGVSRTPACCCSRMECRRKASETAPVLSAAASWSTHAIRGAGSREQILGRCCSGMIPEQSSGTGARQALHRRCSRSSGRAWRLPRKRSASANSLALEPGLYRFLVRAIETAVERLKSSCSGSRSGAYQGIRQDASLGCFATSRTQRARWRRIFSPSSDRHRSGSS